MWEIYAYQNSESLFGIFNSVAAIMGSSTYLSAAAAVVFCGFVAALLAYAFAPEKLHGWKWLGSVVLVYGVLFVPRVTVGIVDKTGGGPVKVVANVPFGMAMFGGLTSVIGNSLTELFETAFQTIPGPGALAGEFAYQQNGLMFGNRAVRAARNANILDPALRMDLVNFIANCTTYDLVDGTIAPKAFTDSDDLWTLVGTPNPARFTPITNNAGTQDLLTCPDAYSNLGGRMPNGIAEVQTRLALELHPTLTPLNANAKIGGELEAAFRGRIAAVSKTATDMLYQNAMINAVSDASSLVGQKVNDPAGAMLAYARAQAMSQQNAAWINGAKMAEQALPILRNVIEALTYALFPIFVLLLFLTAGRETTLAVKLYLVVLLWIQLWPPLYSVLNYMGTIYSNYDLGSASSLSTGARVLALRTANTIYGNAISGEAIVGSLVVGIPVLTWVIASKTAQSIGSVLSSGMGDLKSTGAAVAAAGAAGNYNAGNATLEQRSISPTTSNPFVSRAQAANADWFTHDGTGRVAVSKLRNEGLASHTVSVKVSEQDVAAAGRSAEVARTDAISAVRERSAALSDVYSRAAARLISRRSSTGTSNSSSDESGKDVAELSSIIDSVAKATKVDRSQVAQVGFAAAARGNVYGRAEASATLGTPDILPASVKVTGAVGTQASLEGAATGSKSFASGLSQSDQQVFSALNSQQVGAFKRFADRVSKDESLVRAVSADDREAKELSSRLASTSSQAERAEAAYAQRQSIAEEVRSAYEKGETFNIDLAQDPRFVGLHDKVSGWIRDGHNVQALHVLLTNEVARVGMPANRTFTDGSGMPTSFGELRAVHAAHAGDPRLQQGPEAQARANAERVRRGLVALPGSGGSADTTGRASSIAPSHRRDIEDQSKALKDRTQSVGGFDQRHEIVRDAVGNASTNKSLVIDAASQVGDDASRTVENLKALVAPTKPGGTGAVAPVSPPKKH